jgi:dUTP pyrophosphatase
MTDDDKIPINRIQVRIMRLPHAADLPLPAYQSAYAAGLDLVAAVPADVTKVPIIIAPGGRAAIPTGLAFALPAGIEGQVRSRSGLALHFGVTVLNSPGTVDPDYRGEVYVILANLGAESFIVERGARIAQLVFVPIVQSDIHEVAALDETTCGVRGFGRSRASSPDGGEHRLHSWMCSSPKPDVESACDDEYAAMIDDHVMRGGARRRNPSRVIDRAAD